MKLTADLENQVFDPAAAEFNSLLSYGAMSLIAPTIFGDFQSPTAVSLPSISGGSGFMRSNSGLDPVAANAIDTIIQPDLMVNVTALLADAIGVGPSSRRRRPSEGRRRPTRRTMAASARTIRLRRARPERGSKRLERTAEPSFSSRSRPAASSGIRLDGGAAVQFPRGVFVRGDGGDPLSLGPSGDPTNLPRPVAHSDWCRPFATPFSLSGPLESIVVWILLSIVLAALLVAWLSRGHRLPAA